MFFLHNITRCHRCRGLNQSNESDPSASAISNGHLIPLDDHRHLALPVGALEHGVHVLLILFDVNVVVPLIGRPGPFRIGSTGLSVNNHLCTHGFLLIDSAAKSADGFWMVNRVARQGQGLMLTGGALYAAKTPYGGMRRRPTAIGQGLRLSLNI